MSGFLRYRESGVGQRTSIPLATLTLELLTSFQLLDSINQDEGEDPDADSGTRSRRKPLPATYEPGTADFALSFNYFRLLGHLRLGNSGAHLTH